MKAPLAVVALAASVAVGGCSGESSPSAEPSPSASITLAPQTAVSAEIRRLKIQVRSERRLDVYVLVHPGTSRCGRTWVEEAEIPLSESIGEVGTRPGTDVVQATFYGQPNTYRVCAYFDTVPAKPTGTPRLVLVKTAMFRIAPLNRVMGIGRFGLWRLNQKFVRRPGFEGSFPSEIKPKTSCRQSFRDASRVDTYADGVLLAWIDGVLAGVRTTFAGDRSEDGFVIGTARLNSVRARHPDPDLRVTRGGLPDYDTSTGDWRPIAVAEHTAAGTVELRYWFDRKGVLVALETSIRRC